MRLKLGKSSEAEDWAKPESIAAKTLGRLKIGKEAIISLILFGVAWQIVSLFTPSYIVPGWQVIFDKMIRLQPYQIYVTVVRVVLALVVSFGLGVLGAVVMYLSKKLENYISPLVKLVMAVPVICWILFAVLWFSAVEFRIFFILVIVCCPVFLIDVLDALKGVPKDLRDMILSFRPSKMQYIRKLLLPAIVPAVLTSWKINLSLAIRVVTIAELVGAVSGIGFALNIAQANFSVAEVFAWTIVLILILLAAQVPVSWVESKALRWRL
ncbi:MAG: ABC transporter permease subunit [Nitrososphaerales archaeon]